MKDAAESPKPNANANAKAKSPQQAQAESPASSADPAESIADSDEGHGDETHFEIVRKSSKVQAVAELGIAKLDSDEVELVLQDIDVEMGRLKEISGGKHKIKQGNEAAVQVKVKQVNLKGQPVNHTSLKK